MLKCPLVPGFWKANNLDYIRVKTMWNILRSYEVSVFKDKVREGRVETKHSTSRLRYSKKMANRESLHTVINLYTAEKENFTRKWKWNKCLQWKEFEIWNLMFVFDIPYLLQISRRFNFRAKIKLTIFGCAKIKTREIPLLRVRKN